MPHLPACCVVHMTQDIWEFFWKHWALLGPPGVIKLVGCGPENKANMKESCIEKHIETPSRHLDPAMSEAQKPLDFQLHKPINSPVNIN